MDKRDGERSISFLTKALSGFSGILLYGGTRVYAPSQTKSGYSIYPTILEVPPKLRKKNPGMVSFGIIPKMTTVEYSPLGLIIGVDKQTGNLTVIHPNQDICLVLQKDVDRASFWDAEWQECLNITTEFLAHRHPFGACLISYNGGKTTAKEIEAWANNQLPVILIAGSGRVTDEFANNSDWLSQHPSVSVCKNTTQVRNIITSLGGLTL